MVAVAPVEGMILVGEMNQNNNAKNTATFQEQ